MKNVLRRLSCFVLIIALVCTSVNLECFAATQVDGTMGTPENLIWKEESTATAAWNAVENANYYIVNVYVSYNGSELGSDETGTASTEIDLQQEINSIVGNANYSKVQVTFDVQAKQINGAENTYILGNVSAKSLSTDYLISAVNKTKFKTPTNLTLNDSLDATWNGDPNTDMFYVEFKFDNEGDVRYYLTYIYPYNGRDTAVLSANISTELYRAYRETYAQKTETKVSYRLYSTYFSTNDKALSYYSSDWSDWSDEILYSHDLNDRVKYETPYNLTLDAETLKATWNGDPNTDMFYVQFRFEHEGNEKYYTTYIYPYDGRDTTSLSADISTELYRGYREVYTEKTEVQVSYRLYSTYFSTNDKDLLYYSSDWSEWSDKITYNHDLNDKVKFEMPSNLTLDAESLKATWNGDPDTDMFYVQFKFSGVGEEKYYMTYIYPYDGRDTNTLSADISNELTEAYQNSGVDPAPVLVSYRLYSTYFSTNDKDLLYYPSDWSDWSNEILYNPNNLTAVEKINLSPVDPVVAVGDEIYLGKTIFPENAYYTNIQWLSSDANVAAVNNVGKISGVSVGSSVITAKIGTANAIATVNVYQIESNIGDDESEKTVIDTATDIIESIVTDGDVSGTDITNVNVARNEIEDGAKNGDDFNVDIQKDEKKKSQYSEQWGKIKNNVNSDAEFAGAYNVTIGISHEDNKGKNHHIGNITDLDKEIKFTLDVQDGLPGVSAGATRTYEVVRVHDGQVENIPVEQNMDGLLTVKSDRFSDFVLFYTDTVCAHNNIEIKGQKQATCKDDGYTGDTYCKDCGMKVSSGTVTARTMTHTYDEGVITTAPTVNSEGIKKYTCKVCGETKIEKIPKLKSDKKSVKQISISGSNKVVAGKKITLKVKIKPVNATNKAVTWKSSNKKYATVNSKGVVTAKKAGKGKTVTITATAKDGSKKKATFKIKIVKDSVSKITLKVSSTLKVGKTVKINAKVKTTGSTASKALVWTSSNKKYATVDKNGRVKALKAGKGKNVIITATAADGSGRKAKVKIKIK